MNKETIIVDSIEKFNNGGYNCAQTIIFAMNQAKPVLDQAHYETYLKIARGFGGGIAGLKQTCGYLTGAAIGYTLYYNADDLEYKSRIKAVSDIIDTFSNSTLCSSITQDYPVLQSKDRKAHCTSLLTVVLDYIVSDLI